MPEECFKVSKNYWELLQSLNKVLGVKRAHETLSDEGKRRQYDKTRQSYKRRGLLVQKEFDEEFEKRAFEENPFSETEEEQPDPPASKEKQAIIDKIELCVKAILNSPRDKTAIADLKQLNNDLMAQNNAEGAFTTSHMPPTEKYLQKIGKERERLVKIIQSDGDIEERKNAWTELKELRMQLEDRLEDMEIPKTWAFDLPPHPSSTGKGKGPANYPPPGKGKGPANYPPPGKGKGPANYPPHQPNGGASSSNEKRSGDPPPPAGTSGAKSQDHMDYEYTEKGGDGKQQDSAGSGGAKTQYTGRMDVNWKPGETTRGEKILAYRPIRSWAQVKGTGQTIETEKVNDFVIEQDGEPNPIEIVNGARVGQKAVNAYLALPEELKNSITNIDRKYNRTHGPHIEVKGFARKFSENISGSLPWGVVLIDYDGEDRIINRSALRNACPGSADDMINEFLIEIGEEPEDPKYVRMRLRLENTRNQLRLRDTRDQLRSERERWVSRRGGFTYYSDSDSDSDSLFVSSRPKRRKGSRRLNSRQTVKPVEQDQDRVQSDHRGRSEETRHAARRSEQRDENNSPGSEMVTRDELKKMMDRMMEQISTKFMQMQIQLAGIEVMEE
jgi:curved DNA-binding protein CbpA